MLFLVKKMSAWKSVQSRRFTVEENWFISGEVDGVKAISTSANTTLTAEQQQMSVLPWLQQEHIPCLKGEN